MIRVLLPYHLRTLARVDSEVLLEVESPPTLSARSRRARGPLSGLARDDSRPDHRATPAFRQILRLQRRPVTPSAGQRLTRSYRLGEEPFLVIGAIAGG